MAWQPKTEPGFSPMLASSSYRNLEDMSISELIAVLRPAFQMEDFDRVEEVLVNRDLKLKAEIRPLREKIELERLATIHAKEKLKKREEQCEKGKRAQDCYEKLLKEVKQSNFVNRGAIEELRRKNMELESENCELKELRKKMVVDSIDDKNALTALRMKTSELEEAMKKNMATIEELRNENCKLEDEKHESEELVRSLERKFGELNERVVRLEDDTTKLLMGVDASGGGNIEREEPQTATRVTFEVKDEEDVHDYEFGMDTGGATPLQRNEEYRRSLGGGGTAQPLSKGSKDARGASAGGRLELRNGIEIISLDDDDEDGCTSQGLHRKKSISEIVRKNEQPSSSVAVQQKNIFTKALKNDMVKRKFSFPDIDISASDSSSSDDSLNIDNLPSRSPVTKKSKN